MHSLACKYFCKYFSYNLSIKLNILRVNAFGYNTSWLLNIGDLGIRDGGAMNCLAASFKDSGKLVGIYKVCRTQRESKQGPALWLNSKKKSYKNPKTDTTWMHENIEYLHLEIVIK